MVGDASEHIARGPGRRVSDRGSRVWNRPVVPGGGGRPPRLSQVLSPIWWWSPPAETKALGQLEAQNTAVKG